MQEELWGILNLFKIFVCFISVKPRERNHGIYHGF